MNAGLLRYRLLLRLLSPPILLFNAWQAARAGEPRLFSQRLGLGLRRRDDAPLWLHAASVGEVKAARPLILALHERHPALPILVTTLTPTGAALAKQSLPPGVEHAYLPMDWPGAGARFLRATRPRAALIMETELWPNLFSHVAAREIPLLIVNGRLSARSREAAGWIRRLHASALQRVTGVLARSADDANAYVALGAPAGRVQTVGNIKFADAGTGTTPAPSLGRPYVLAASTHEDEERQLALLWQRMGERTRGRLLVIAPRHPQRRDAILKHLGEQRVALRSRGDRVDADTRIYLADTLGELEGFMAGAELVFMGGSLVPRGGHNILEPARLGRAVIFGPHMGNFLAESELLLGADAALQVADAQQLGATLAQLLADEDRRLQLGRKARALMARQADVLEAYLQQIEQHCALAQSAPEAPRTSR